MGFRSEVVHTHPGGERSSVGYLKTRPLTDERIWKMVEEIKSSSPRHFAEGHLWCSRAKTSQALARGNVLKEAASSFKRLLPGVTDADIVIDHRRRRVLHGQTSITLAKLESLDATEAALNEKALVDIGANWGEKEAIAARVRNERRWL